MNPILIPCGTAEGWAQFLAEPIKQWRKGYSARTLAYSWHAAQGFPAEVAAALATSKELAGCELLLAIPEHQVPLPGGSRPSQNDIWVLARTASGLVSIAVEGKVAEPFGPTVTEWLGQASPGKLERLAFLQQELGLAHPLPGTVRYQLLHRAASAVIEAKRFHAAHALMLVHSFSQNHQWFEDYGAFAALFNRHAKTGEVVAIGETDGVQIHLGWVCGDAAYLSA